MYARPQTLFVPVSSGSTHELCSIRTYRLPDGRRTGVAFTDPTLLRTAMGSEQQWIAMALPAFHALLAPLGVHTVQVDADRIGSHPGQPSTGRPGSRLVTDMAAGPSTPCTHGGRSDERRTPRSAVAA